MISVDTWRAEVGRIACGEGADLLNDAWGGVDPELAEVAAEHGVGLVCTHAGGATPRTRPHRVAYDDVVADVLDAHRRRWPSAPSALGVRRDGVLLDPGHDFGKNTRHSLEATRRLAELVATGWPVLVSLSNKDFVGETLDVAGAGERLVGTLAATAVVGVARRPGVPRPQRRRDPRRRWTWSPASPAPVRRPSPAAASPELSTPNVA